MRIFHQAQLSEAIEYAGGGGQALHMHRFVFAQSPECFRKAIDRGEHIAHLFDADEQRLHRTAARLGVRKIVIEKRGTAKQHVDLCGKPLERALEEAQQPALIKP